MPNKFNWESLVGIAMIVMGSTLTALMKPQVNIWQTLKYWGAGIIAGAIVVLLCYSNNYTGVWADLAKVGVSTFVTVIYPVAEKLFTFYFKKKTEDLTGIKAPEVETEK